MDDDTAHELAFLAGLVWDDDRAALAPLIDATIVWADEEQLDAIAAPIVERLWADGLRADIERALVECAERMPAVAKQLAAARVDLGCGPAGSRLALAYVKHGAVDLADEALFPGTCLCCCEDGLGAVPPEQQEQIAVNAAAAIVMRADPDFGAEVPNDAEAAAARKRLSEIAALAAQSLPRLSAALEGISVEAVWRAAHAERRAAIAARN